jgi:hypothetical protein
VSLDSKRFLMIKQDPGVRAPSNRIVMVVNALTSLVADDAR